MRHEPLPCRPMRDETLPYRPMRDETLPYRPMRDETLPCSMLRLHRGDHRRRMQCPDQVSRVPGARHPPRHASAHHDARTPHRYRVPGARHTCVAKSPTPIPPSSHPYPCTPLPIHTPIRRIELRRRAPRDGLCAIKLPLSTSLQPSAHTSRAWTLVVAEHL
jgi:hypothetical protein